MSAADKAATFSGTLAIPISTTASAIAMRIVAAFSTIPGDPCGSYDYGETEDYILVVQQPCTPPVASLSGTTTITTGQTATLTATLTGSSPFSLTVNTSNSSPITFTGITTSPFTFTVTPVISTTYTLANVLNGCATGTGSGIAVVTVNSCTTMYTVKIGSWDDPTVWSCNRLPTQTDLVTVGHQVTIPNGFIAKALQVNYTVGGQLAINPTGQLLFQP